MSGNQVKLTARGAGSELASDLKKLAKLEATIKQIDSEKSTNDQLLIAMAQVLLKAVSVSKNINNNLDAKYSLEERREIAQKLAKCLSRIDMAR